MIEIGRRIKAREALARLRHGASLHEGAPISVEEILEWKSAGRR